MNVYEIDPALRTKLETMGVALQQDESGKVALVHRGFDRGLLESIRNIPEVGTLVRGGEIEPYLNVI